jgi:hypothetical protein
MHLEPEDHDKPGGVAFWPVVVLMGVSSEQGELPTALERPYW